MISYFLSALKYFFPNFYTNPVKDNNDDNRESFLLDQLVNLELDKNNILEDEDDENIDSSEKSKCIQKTGIITFCDDNHVVIDGMYHYDTAFCHMNFYVNSTVLYLAYIDETNTTHVVEILESDTESLDPDIKPITYEVTDHIIVGEVSHREKRVVFIKDIEIKFNLDSVLASFVPITGDWLEMKCSVKCTENETLNQSQVLKVVSLKPLRQKIQAAVVTEWNGEYGVCDRRISFYKDTLLINNEITLGSKVMVDAIESNQGSCSWRALKITLISNNAIQPIPLNTPENDFVALEKKYAIEMTCPIEFDNVDINGSEKLTIHITNNSSRSYFMTKWIIPCRRKDSQITVEPVINRCMKLSPNESFSFTITCSPKFLGKTKEQFIIFFKGFKIERTININVVDSNLTEPDEVNRTSYTKSYRQKIEDMRDIRNSNNNTPCLFGGRPIKPPAFIPVKLGTFNIPNKIWDVILGNAAHTNNNFDQIMERIEQQCPHLTQYLNINNYIMIWHDLLYMEEVELNIRMRTYDMSNVYIFKSSDYIAMEVNNLTERRPSLLPGDKVVLRGTWNNTVQEFEGYIHEVKSNLVLMKFHPYFHENYCGKDIKAQFHFSRSTFRRAHQAINLVLSNLGPDILFPCSIKAHPNNHPKQNFNSIEWFNKTLNMCQRAAVTRILQANCHPMPYIIFGPPGTGKTVTVIETILQILANDSNSRILVATPSNSAANLITEKLINYKNENVFQSSIIRLIAHYLANSNNIPDIIKPYCATMDIESETTKRSNQHVWNNINMSCKGSFIGRHRVTIGTCYCIGTLTQMGLPAGHFTHVIVDEAGQATEPEIMIPLSFTDSRNGHIILAGDPMQLGPVVISRYCQEFGMDESYLCRLLQTVPYQKDLQAFKDGFNEKLVTKLNDNYRSLKEVISLSNDLFYDGTLAENINRNETWVLQMMKTISEIFEIDNPSGGIFVYGIRGTCSRAEDSPSWFNIQEAMTVALTTSKLFKKNINVNELGIITPYVAQVKYLRILFSSMGLLLPKIGTVEEFQGQEREIIIISTVRSYESNSLDNENNNLGFISNPKRLNVALTRAKIATFLVCDPHLLSKDRLWRMVITQAVADKKYSGCNLPGE